MTLMRRWILKISLSHLSFWGGFFYLPWKKLVVRAQNGKTWSVSSLVFLILLSSCQTVSLWQSFPNLGSGPKMGCRTVVNGSPIGRTECIPMLTCKLIFLNENLQTICFIKWWETQFTLYVLYVPDRTPDCSWLTVLLLLCPNFPVQVYS